MPLAELAPAKINLALHVIGRRKDGYHLLESLVGFAELGDLITVKTTEADSFSVDGCFATDVPIDDSNLVLRARDMLRAAYPGYAQPVSIALEKNLPVASGIGSGSSDAAATLRVLVRLWRIPADESELARLSLPLGADLPMCIAGRPLMARGIGEHLELIKDFPNMPIVLVNPGIAIATPDVFRAIARHDNPPLVSMTKASAMLEWLAASRNDLKPAAISIVPTVDDVLQALRQSGAAFARMSGSGATCFGIFNSTAAATRAAEVISSVQPNWFTATTSLIPQKPAR